MIALILKGLLPPEIVSGRKKGKKRVNGDDYKRTVAVSVWTLWVMCDAVQSSTFYSDRLELIGIFMAVHHCLERDVLKESWNTN